jgi:hypothetical protein
MKSKNTFKTNWNELIKRHGNFLKKSLFIGVTAAAFSVLSGCQDQRASIEPQNLNCPVFVNESTPKSVPAQLVSKVTFYDDHQEESLKANYKAIESPVFRDTLASQYHNTPVLNLELAKKSWRDTYDGKGLPLFRISF